MFGTGTRGIEILFQSAPAIAGGRCGAAVSVNHSPVGFNPRPPLLAGDAMRTLRNRGVTVVSIRARHCWRAMLDRSMLPSPIFSFQSAPAIAGGRCLILLRLSRRCYRFNPRPPLLAGDAPRWRSPSSHQTVSIRARHCWRAMLTSSLRYNAVAYVSIRARHCWRAMRQSRHRRWRSTGFQSAPAIAGGRCGPPRWHSRGLPRFNPRSPLLAGDASWRGGL